MLFKAATLGPEQAFIEVRNAPGVAQSITTGYPVCLATPAASFDMTQAVVMPGTSNNPGGFVGIAFKDIGANQFGLIQTYGWIGSIALSNTGNSLTINSGDTLVPAPAGMFSAVPTWANSGWRYVLASNVPAATSAPAYCSGFIRAI